jgi:glycosyltransferase involved in cell wall biosynthesis
MAFDCPIVSTDCFEAARELVGGAEGCTVVPPDDPAALAAAIGSALEQPGRPHLRPIAERYSLAAATESHRAAMGLKGS